MLGFNGLPRPRPSNPSDNPQHQRLSKLQLRSLVVFVLLLLIGAVFVLKKSYDKGNHDLILLTAILVFIAAMAVTVGEATLNRYNHRHRK